MADEESHTEGHREGSFCAIRTGPTQKCDCGENYVQNCQSTQGWDKYPQHYTQTIKDKVTKAVKEKFLTAIRKAYEAHHIACVASVTGTIAKNTEIQPIVNRTEWCINRAPNVIALPLWAMTIEYYCILSRASPLRAQIAMESEGKFQFSPFSAPLFENLPQHDYDHGKYLKEVDSELERVAAEVEKNKGDHAKGSATLLSELTTLVNHFKSELESVRGHRVGGTHAAWNLGMNFRDSEWYLPFSMAKDAEAEARTFPLPDLSDGGTLAEKIMEVAEAFWLEGQQISLLF